MRTVKVTCDRCGQEIRGYPVQIIPEYVDGPAGDFSIDALAPCQASQTDRHYCEPCTEQIVAYANASARPGKRGGKRC